MLTYFSIKKCYEHTNWVESLQGQKAEVVRRSNYFDKEIAICKVKSPIWNKDLLYCPDVWTVGKM